MEVVFATTFGVRKDRTDSKRLWYYGYDRRAVEVCGLIFPRVGQALVLNLCPEEMSVKDEFTLTPLI